MTDWLFDAQLVVAGVPILWREVVGNLFGLASAIGGMRRRVWAWPVGVAGNVLLLTVFLGGLFDTPQAKDLYGQAARQVFFAVVAVYGWVRWRQARGAGGPAVVPRWAGARARWGMLVAAVVGTVVSALVFRALGSWGPWADGWIFTGSLLATYGMARGWTEFWLVWIAVDAVGVPLLLQAGYYPSAALYAVYGGVVLYGFVVWLRAQRAGEPQEVTASGGAGTLVVDAPEPVGRDV
ncbi:nicotinamide riboside transporter PnuC [Cellulomonas sp.]|uniref:nicotinamide riboside transporter PnuC n=1 Tax=Cellulomonas sp. TaxID=40001 RepID=UPI0028128889|nr:nicotinamide riboside transporter PnuC [Cellulomonas sp.]